MKLDIGELATKFAGGLLGKVGEKLASFIPTKEERRRNVIDKLEKRKRFIEGNQRNDLRAEYLHIDAKLKQLYQEAKNS